MRSMAFSKCAWSSPGRRSLTRFFTWGTAFSLMVLTGEARAQPQPAPPSPATSTGSSPALDFNYFGDQDSGQPRSAEQDATLSERASRRRWMLTTHQTLGVATWALMVATVTVGQLNYNQIYGGGGGSTKYQAWHRDLVIGASSTFTAAAAFAIFAPTPYPKPLRFDTGLIHRLAAIGATAGMVTELILGFTTNRQANEGNAHSLGEMARAHQVIGYTTLGFLTVAGTVWLF